jgi:hypothetical protein
VKNPIKISISVILVLFFALITILAINATDEQQTELTKQMLQKFPAQKGFEMKGFKLSQKDRAPNSNFEKYSDYIKDPAKYDELIKRYQKSLEVTEKAFRAEHVAEDPNASFYDGINIYHPADHSLFQAFLSQKIKQGNLPEALNLLEQSNKFLASIVESHQIYINKLIALNLLRKNAEFVKNLKDEGVMMKAPDSLKSSFKLTQDPEKIWEEAGKTEFLLSSTVILGPIDETTFNMTDAFDEEENLQSRVLGKVTAWFYPKLLRRNQTLNWMSAGYAALASPVCVNPSSQQCNEVYEKAISSTKFNFFINPVGRFLYKLFLPGVSWNLLKFHSAIKKLKEAVEAI